MSCSIYECERCGEEKEEFFMESGYGLGHICDSCYRELSEKYQVNIKDLFRKIGYAQGSVNKKYNEVVESYWDKSKDELNQYINWFGKGKNKSIQPYTALDILRDVIEGKGRKANKELAQKEYDRIEKIIDNRWKHII